MGIPESTRGLNAGEGMRLTKACGLVNTQHGTTVTQGVTARGRVGCMDYLLFLQ